MVRKLKSFWQPLSAALFLYIYISNSFIKETTQKSVLLPTFQPEPRALSATFLMAVANNVVKRCSQPTS